MNKQRRRTYRLWQELEPQLEAKAKEMNVTPAKALNILLAQALGAQVKEDDVEPKRHPLADFDAF